MLMLLSLEARSIALFGKVAGVASDDVLNVRAQPNYKARKVGELPPNATVGIERCRKIGRSQWCRVYQLVQNLYSEDFHPGWVNARFLKSRNRGYVQIRNRKNDCYYSLQCKDDRCEVVTDASYDAEGMILWLQKGWIDRSYLRGESRFGSASNDMEGYCTFDHRIEDYEKKQHVERHAVAYKKTATHKLRLAYPTIMKVSKHQDGSITVYYDKPLKHYSGSDERDDAPLLYKRELFNVTVSIYPTLKQALQKDFGSGLDHSLGDDLNYDATTDRFMGASQDGFVASENFYGKKAYKIMIGVEGSGIVYHYFRQNGKTVVVSQRYDRNLPLDPKTRRPIPGQWSLPNETEIVRNIVSSVKVK